ncbi:hypothetical protein T265_01252 [Opisthorchis viverrini]|uniref:GPN-loop GTPase 3 n=2 Tax=Opisthorchis viverrini TaxID=6198 RepID=A0A075AJ50_OPIVI|nr:hypothetical protein T265_01252 [Opisthorchis viverrini]KER32769.1 hypothetical protein T265_01252 [Opisthorchis viverrini]
MPRFAQLVIGPAGCGKSTYCATLQAHCETLHRTVDVVNLDPAAEYFEYNPIADIRDLIHVDDVMQDSDIHLGPNGGLIFCMEYLSQNLDWLDTALGDCENDYVLFDCPGQVELFSHLPIMPRIVEHLQRKWDFRFVTVFVLDARFLVDSSHFMAGVLAALSSMVALATAHINIMSKMDLLPLRKQKYVIARYLSPDMNYFLDCDADDHSAVGLQTKYTKLNSALAGLIERYSVVHFMPLNRDNEETISDILQQIDHCLQYDEEVDPPNRIFDAAEQELAGFERENDDEGSRLCGCHKVGSKSTYSARLTLETITHGCLGVIFWLFCAISLSPTEHGNWCFLVESSMWAAIFAVSLDLDHFICSGTFSLQGALQLPGRPFLHWLGFPLMLHTVLLCFPLIYSPKDGSLLFGAIGFLWVVNVAYWSHIVRDSRHRGIWVWPPPSSRTWTSPSSRLGEDLYWISETPALPALPVYLLALSLLIPSFRYSVAQLNFCASSFSPLLSRAKGGPDHSFPHPVHQFRRPFIIGFRGWLTFVSIVPTRASLYTFGVTNGSADSKKWLARQLSDPYVKLARIESFRCRSAFKLLQLQEKLSGSLISPGDIVVDCGAAPGSWSQVATSFVSPSPGGSSTGSSSGLVIAFDLLDFAPLPGVSRFCKVDVRDSAKCVQLVNQTVRDYLKRLGSTTFAEGSLSRVNVVLSDMAPNVTGLRELDVPAMMNLASSVLQLAVRTSAPGASLVVKLWQSPEAEEFMSIVSRFYRGPWNSAVKPPNHKRYPQTKQMRQEDPGPAVRFFKPAASRSDSSEIYLIARGFQLPDVENKC